MPEGCTATNRQLTQRALPCSALASPALLAGPWIPAPNPRPWTRLQKARIPFPPSAHTRAGTTGLQRGELTPGKRQKHDEGRSSLQRKFYIAYDLLSGNIKQFKQPTLNHSDSSTLPTALPPLACPPLPAPNTRSSRAPGRAAHACALTLTLRDTAGTRRVEDGGDEPRSHH